ncbi:alpha/beta hydrolase [Marinicrinis sediminis]|uniref:Alpha/beta hydrolase n=1 Tax=Marinicrinis sediminis TaxID=1652465 RepID=A0ABW5RGC4_9BACL
MDQFKRLPLILFMVILTSCASGNGNEGEAQPVQTSKTEPPHTQATPNENEPPVYDVTSPIHTGELYANQQGHTLTGDVYVIPQFEVPQLDTTRRIWIYLPPSYEMDQNKRYPVLYMHDAQNLFDSLISFSGEWSVDEAIQKLSLEDEKWESIVIGIENGGDDRNNELVPWVSSYGFGGKGDAYVDFIVETLKPYVDEQFRTLTDPAHTSIAGSSLGAYISLYAALTYPDVFGHVGAFSFVMWFDDNRMMEYVEQVGKLEDVQIYVDAGMMEAEIVEPVKALYRQLLSTGYGEEQLKFIIDPEGAHIESAWKKRFPDAYQWWMQKQI